MSLPVLEIAKYVLSGASKHSNLNKIIFILCVCDRHKVGIQPKCVVYLQNAISVDHVFPGYRSREYIEFLIRPVEAMF